MKRRTRYFLNKILLSPRHFINVLQIVLSFRFRLDTAYGEPIVVDIEPTNACNFRCPHCEVTYAADEKKTLSISQYNVIVNSFPYALRVKLQGGGEPFINKTLYDLIESACSKGVWCEVFTNGSIIDMERLKPIERFENFQLVVSFDAAEKRTFEKIRAGSSFEKVLENIDNVTGNSTIDVAAWMVLQEDNAGQVKEVIRLLARKKVKSLGIQRLFSPFDNETKKNNKWIKQDLTEGPYATLKKYARQYGVQLSISEKFYNREHICPWPWMGVFVDTSGNVTPCCRIGANVYKVGSINENNFEEIWNSSVYKDFRRRHKVNDLPEFCRGCYS